MVYLGEKGRICCEHQHVDAVYPMNTLNDLIHAIHKPYTHIAKYRLNIKQIKLWESNITGRLRLSHRIRQMVWL